MRTFTQNEPLTDAELDRLGDFLKNCKGGKAMNVEALDGFFAALIAGPETVMPSEYYPEVFGGVLVRVDILQRRRDNRWRLLEVKSTTDLKDHHLDDIGIQARVVSRAGLDLASSRLMHVNRNYVFEGGASDCPPVLQDQEPHSPDLEARPQAHVPATSRVHRPQASESTGHRSGSALHRFGRVRVLRPLTSAPGRSHLLAAANPRERG